MFRFPIASAIGPSANLSLPGYICLYPTSEGGSFPDDFYTWMISNNWGFGHGTCFADQGGGYNYTLEYQWALFNNDPQGMQDATNRAFSYSGFPTATPPVAQMPPAVIGAPTPAPPISTTPPYSPVAPLPPAPAPTSSSGSPLLILAAIGAAFYFLGRRS